MSRLRPYLQLMRLPAVFTAMSNIVLGFVLVHGATLKHEDCPLAFCLLLLSSSCLYLGGMVWNDVFDRKVDAEERPNRPIPSGRVPLTAAIGIGGGLVVAGLAAAAFVSATAAAVAILLTVAIFTYNGYLKQTTFGPVSMGLCRVLNILLGGSAALEFADVWTAPQVNVALALGIYIVGVTGFAKGEAGDSDRRKLGAAAFVINSGLCGLLFLALNGEYGVGGVAPRIRVVAAWFAIVMVIDRFLTLALLDPSPKAVQTAVKTMIQWLIPLDATLVYAATGDAALALGTAALIVPTLLIGRWVYVT